MVVIPEGASLVGDPPPVWEETELSPQIEVGDSESPEIRQSSRKMVLRSVSSRGRLAKSRPKSTMIRMVEMKKNGLQGRALRLSGNKGLDGPGLIASKGRKGHGGKGARVLAPMPESEENRAESQEGLRVEGGVAKDSNAEVAAMAEDRGVKGLLEVGFAGLSDQGVNLMESSGRSDGRMEEGLLGMSRADEVLVELPQGTLIDGGSLLSPEIISVGGVGCKESGETSMVALAEIRGG